MHTTALTPASARLFSDYTAWLAGTAALAASTTGSYRGYVRDYLTWLAGQHPETPARRAARAHLEGYLAHLRRRGSSAATRRVALHALRSFYRWLLGRADTPAAAVRRPRARPPVTNPYTEAQADAILATTATSSAHTALADSGAADVARLELARVVLATLRWTGLRSHELCGQPLAGLDLDAQQLTVIGKGHRQRVVPFPDVLGEHLEHYLTYIRPQLPSSPLLFANPHAQTPTGVLTGRALLEICRRHGARAGVPGVHTALRWRHTYATLTLARGMDQHTLARLLGHSRIETTQRYLALDTGQLTVALHRAYPSPAGDSAAHEQPDPRSRRPRDTSVGPPA